MSSTSSQVMSRFCDYFVVCGLDDGAGLEVQATVDVDGTRKNTQFIKYCKLQFVIGNFCFTVLNLV